MSIFTILIQLSVGSSSQGYKARKGIKDKQIENEEIKPSLFIHNLVMQIIPRNSKKQYLSELVNEFSKVARIQNKHTKINYLPIY